MQTRFKKGVKFFDVGITAVAGMLSVGIMLYGVFHFGLAEAWPELVLNLFYVACLVMIWMYFFNRLDSQRFNYWCSVSVGILCTQELEELYQKQPVGHLHHRHTHSRALQLGHLLRAYRRVHQLFADRNLDSPHHHLRNGGLFRDGS